MWQGYCQIIRILHIFPFNLGYQSARSFFFHLIVKTLAADVNCSRSVRCIHIHSKAQFFQIFFPLPTSYATFHLFFKGTCVLRTLKVQPSHSITFAILETIVEPYIIKVSQKTGQKFNFISRKVFFWYLPYPNHLKDQTTTWSCTGGRMSPFANLCSSYQGTGDSFQVTWFYLS